MAKARGKRELLAYSRGLMPTKERQQKQGGVIFESINEKDGSKVYTTRGYAAAECTLDHYKYLKKISEIEHSAGIKFRQAYCTAVLHILTGDSSGSHGDPEMAYIKRTHSEEVLRQAYTVLSPAQKSIIIWVCGHDYGVGDTNRLKTFKRGLAELVALWGFS
jgi:uncharacterized protein YjhX (UPF0386 family)